jgi:hypothetical protein
MNVLQARVSVGPDHVLQIPLPADVAPGVMDVVVVLEQPHQPTPDARREAARAGRGMLAGTGLSVQEFLEERREDDARRDRALDL